jgi:hypothetical protein
MKCEYANAADYTGCVEEYRTEMENYVFWVTIVYKSLAIIALVVLTIKFYTTM